MPQCGRPIRPARPTLAEVPSADLSIDLLLAEFPHKVAWRQDPDATKWRERQQIRITRDDVGGAPGDGKLENLVVGRIPAHPQGFDDHNVFSLANVGRQKIEPLLLVDVVIEFWPAQHIVEFFEGGS